MLLFILLQIFVVVHAKVADTVFNFQNLTKHEKVKFQFYYETKSPLSMVIYITQLQDAVEELAPYLDITTYPYGKAQMTLNGTQMTVACPHGKEECYGNMLHACVIYYTTGYAQKYVPFNACMMNYILYERFSNDEAVETCGEEYSFDSEFIMECAKGNKGYQLLLHYGIESEEVEYQKVPWWYVNGVPKESGEKKPLKEILCDAFENPPEVCY